MEHISGIIRRVMKDVTVEDKTVPAPKCLECGQPGDYSDGVCYECASRPFGLHWQQEQEERGA